MKKLFQQISIRISKLAGSPFVFGLAFLGIIIWLISGPVYNFSNTWLIFISTITDVIIFLIVFSIQNTQNRDSKAIQLKLNELISADKKARDSFIGLETLTDEELTKLDQEFNKLIREIEDVNHPIHKIHRQIKREQTHRPFYQQTAKFVGKIIEAIDKPL